MRVNHDDFSYVHMATLLTFNPIICLNYYFFFSIIVAFFYSLGLFLYALLCYIVACQLAAGASRVAYDNLRRYNRGSLFRQLMFFVAIVATYGKATFAPRMCFVTIFHYADY